MTLTLDLDLDISDDVRAQIKVFKVTVRTEEYESE